MKSHSLAIFNGSYLGKKPTGIGVVARDLAQALDPLLVPLLDPLGGSRKGSIKIPGDLTPDFGRKGHIRRLIWTQNKLPKILNKTEADLLLSPLPEAPIFRGVRSVVLAHDLIPLRYPRLSPLLAYHLFYIPMVLHRAEKILCNSYATAREIHARLGISQTKLVTIPLGFNRESLSPLDCQREPFFLVLGRHDPHKNLIRLLKAFSILRNKEIKIYFVGPFDRRYTPYLRGLACELGISQRCIWMNWVSEKRKLHLLNTCQALLIPSLWEGFGLPALEAMACDTPVLASNAGALPEVVADGGILIDPKNIADIANGMSEIINDSFLRNKIIENGRKRLNFYSWERSARLIEEILFSLI